VNINGISALLVGSWALLTSSRVLRYDLSIEEIELLFPLVGLFVSFCFPLQNVHSILFPATALGSVA
jgi:hypothetical protein